VEDIPTEWNSEQALRLQRQAFSFLPLSDGSLLSLLKPSEDSPAAVVLLGSEGECRTVANSLEEFLLKWSKGETNIDELDDGECASGRKALGSWLKASKVKSPKTDDFDFQAWLDSENGSAKTAPQAQIKPIQRVPTPLMKQLSPKVMQVAALIGLRADAPEVIEYVTKVLGKKVPQTTNEYDYSQEIEASRAGVGLSFSHIVHNDLYPPIHKTAKSFVPYLTSAWIRKKIAEPIFGLTWKAASMAEITAVLGAPNAKREIFNEEAISYWVWELDSAAHVQLRISFRKELWVILEVVEALELRGFTDVTTGLFVGYAVMRGLLDESRFTQHVELIAQIKQRQAKGSDLVRAALARGLWDNHLVDDALLRSFAHSWFHNMLRNKDRQWITGDLMQVFGARDAGNGHQEPILDDDTWDSVDKAAPVLDRRFAPWLNK
jgi:hypothetical protein